MQSISLSALLVRWEESHRDGRDLTPESCARTGQTFMRN